MKNKMKSSGNDFRPEYFDPTRNDFFYHFFTRFFKNDIIPPVPAAILYFILSSGGTIMLGFFTGLLFGQDSNLSPIYKDHMNIINVGIIAPIGAGLLINLYNKMSSAFIVLKKNNIIADDIRIYDKLLEKLSRLYSRKEVVWLSLLVAAGLNIYFMIKKSDSWSGIHGGITAFYFRLFVTINYYMILIILYKCIITTWAIREIFKLKIIVHPLHPDKCGGLKAIGSLSIAIHYFSQLIIIFLTMIALFNPNSLDNVAFVLAFLSLVVITVLSLFFSLYKAHFKMKSAKEDLLEKLHSEFQKYYDQLFSNLGEESFQKTIADNLQSINSLYAVANKMPVWPFDIHSLARFFTAVSIPILIFIVEMFSNTDSIIYNLDRLNIFKHLIK